MKDQFDAVEIYPMDNPFLFLIEREAIMYPGVFYYEVREYTKRKTPKTKRHLKVVGPANVSHYRGADFATALNKFRQLEEIAAKKLTSSN